MLDLEKEILQKLDLCREEIKNNLEAKGINASGRTSASLRISATRDHFMLVIGGENTAPAETLEIGRPPGAVPKGFTDIIMQWMRDKGLSSGNDKIDRSIAGAIAWGNNGIVKTGTRRHKSQKEDVYSTATQRAASSINEIMKKSIRNEIHAILAKQGGGATTIKSNF